MLRWYQRKLATRPYLTQAVTTAILFATGDTIAQQAVERKGIKDHNLARTGRMALYGGAIFGPAATRWFQFLQEKIVLKNKNLEILARVVVDQSLFTPVNLGCFLSSMAYMEGVPIKEKIDKSYKTAITANWSIWPFIQMVNFKFVPLPHRVLFVNTISIGWNCFLSMINSAGNEEFGVEGKDI